MQVCKGQQQLVDLCCRGIPLVHAVGQQDQPVTGLELPMLQLVGQRGPDAEDRVHLQGQVLDDAVADQQRGHVAGVDELERTAGQV